MEATLVCANHPERETTLRCNRCNKPMCTACAVHTPVGYRCRECVKGQQKGFDTTRRTDYAIAVVLSAVGMAIGTGLLSFIGFFGILLAPLLGGGLAELVRRAVGRRRSRRLPRAVAVAGVVGGLPHLMLPLIGLFFSPGGAAAIGGLVAILWPALIIGLAVSSMYYRLAGIRFGG